MNWNRVLNVLILIFLLLNVVLFVLKQKTDVEKYTLSSEREQQLRDILTTEKNIAVYDYLPAFYPKSRLELQTPQVDQEKIKEMFFEGDVKISMTENNAEKYYDGQQEIYFYKGDNKGVVFYKGTNKNYVPKNSSENAIIETAKKFANDIFLGKAKMVLTHTHTVDGEYIFLFNEQYRKQTLFCNYVTIRIDKNGVKEAQALRYKPLDFLTSSLNIVAVDEALYNLMFSLNNSNNELLKITDIDLGYDLDIDDNVNAVIFEAIPYYRVKMVNGEDYFINAYTNKIKDSIY